MNKGNLLIVDDEPMLLKNLKAILEEYADTVFTATNGLEAIEVLKDNKIHCIICDINMPKMNGVEVIKKVRDEKNNVPFIFYTGHGNRELMMEAAKYGAFDFLDKPQLEGLEEVVALGMQNGFSQSQGETISDNDLMSEYQKMLKDLQG